jgi:rod shape-determining protein MreD
MRWFLFVIFTFIALIAQTALLPVLCPDAFRPWAMVILANILLLTKPDEWTILQVWALGFLGDITSLSPLGSQAVSFGLYGLLANAMRPILFTESVLAHGITAGIAVIVISAIFAIIAFLSQSSLPLPYTVGEVLGQALATALGAGLIVQLFLPGRRRSRSW